MVLAARWAAGFTSDRADAKLLIEDDVARACLEIASNEGTAFDPRLDRIRPASTLVRLRTFTVRSTLRKDFSVASLAATTEAELLAKASLASAAALVSLILDRRAVTSSLYAEICCLRLVALEDSPWSARSSFFSSFCRALIAAWIRFTSASKGAVSIPAEMMFTVSPEFSPAMTYSSTL